MTERRRSGARAAALAGALAAALGAGGAAAGRDALGIFGQWGAFADPAIARCYAIAAPAGESAAAGGAAYASVGTWPRRAVRGQFHLRLPRAAARGGTTTLTIGRSRFALVASGADAWARDARTDAAIVAALRANPAMSVRSRDGAGKAMTLRFDLAGAASALDAATLACARLR